ncbi:MAG: peptide deformylase [Pseudomonadota bacterium]
MLRPILIHPDPRLKKVCTPVPEITEEVRGLLDDMLDTMYAAPGIGLAAPQIGINTRMVVLDCAPREGGDDAEPRPMKLINPEILSASDVVSTFEEGCLSVPDIYADVTRPSEVRVRWTDETGADREEDFTGIWAVCVQHEIDHLDGKLFIDTLGPMRRRLITEKMKKLKRDRARRAEETAES